MTAESFHHSNLDFFVLVSKIVATFGTHTYINMHPYTSVNVSTFIDKMYYIATISTNPVILTIPTRPKKITFI